MMHQHLPARPDIEYYRKQAKALLRAYRSGDEMALPRLNPSGRNAAPALCDAQRAVARESGFRSWDLLRSSVAAQLDGALPNPTPSDPQTKQRYEDDPNVQRWLKTRRRSEGSRLDSGFLNQHHERDWILSSLQTFLERGLITDVVGAVASGKEATVYRCATAEDGEYLAAKVYRPRMFRNLRNDAIYRENRMRGKDRRSQKAMDGKSRRGRAFRMESWITFEYATHRELYEAGVHLPKPVAMHGNAILMEFIGDSEAAAPMLQNVELDRVEASSVFDRLINDVELMLAADRVHADLSAYNVLYWDGCATIIDFAQAVDARSGDTAFALLRRDVDRLAQCFARYGVTADPEGIALGMWSGYSGRSL